MAHLKVSEQHRVGEMFRPWRSSIKNEMEELRLSLQGNTERGVRARLKPRVQDATAAPDSVLP